jgi:biotin operon repressor
MTREGLARALEKSPNTIKGHIAKLKADGQLKRKIRSLVLNSYEYKELEPKIKSSPHILIWEANKK